MKFQKFIFTLFLFSCITISAQEFNIVPYLKQIENGSAASVKKALPALLSDNPKDPSVLFLDAVLTSDGNEALNKYDFIYKNYPESRFADASLYRLFSFYYSMGYYTRAEEYLNKLKNDFPASPYIKAADRSIPETQEIVIPKPEPKTPIAAGKQFNFTIQAGAFLNTQNAVNLRKQFAAEGYYANINSKEVGGSILNVVTVGKFTTEQETEILLTHLKSKYGLNGRVVPFTN